MNKKEKEFLTNLADLLDDYDMSFCSGEDGFSIENSKGEEVIDFNNVRWCTTFWVAGKDIRKVIKNDQSKVVKPSRKK